MKFVRLFLALLLTLSAYAQKSVTYDSTTKQAYPTNLWFLNPSTPTAPTAGTNIVNKDYVDSVAGSIVPFSYNSSLSSGTNAYFNPGTLSFGLDRIVFAGGSIACIASRTNYIGISLGVTNGLRAWRQPFDDGTVWIGEVVTDASSITIARSYPTPRIPPGRIEATKTALKAGLPVDVYVCGSSLVYGTIGSPTNRWLKLLWDGGATVTNYLVNGYAQATVEDRSANSQLMIGNFAMLGNAVTASYFSKYNDNAWIYSKRYTTLYDPSQRYQIPPSGLKKHRLYLVNGSFNNDPVSGSGNKLAAFENFVKEARLRGADVIVTPDQSSGTAGGINARWDDQYPIIKAISEAYGCNFADTASAMDYARATGNNPYYVDNVHQNDVGMACWADAYRGVLNNLTMTSDRGQFALPTYRVAKYEDNPSWNTNSYNTVDWEFVPTVNGAGAGVYFSTSQAATNCPSVWMWNRATTDATIRFNASGVFEEFAHPRAMGMWVCLDATSSFKLEIYDYNRTNLIKSMDIDAEGSTPKVIQLLDLDEIQSLSSYTGLNDENAPWRNVCIQLKCVTGIAPYTGDARIIGIAWPTVKAESIGGQQLSGNWSVAAASYSTVTLPIAFQSNTDLDSFSFTFTGTAAQVILNADEASGIIDVELDGLPYITGKDTYTTTSGTYSLNIFPPSTATQSGSGYGVHNVRIKLNGENPSQTGSPLIRVLDVLQIDQR